MKIIEDLKYYGEGSFYKILATILFNPNFHAIFLFRLAHLLSKIKLFFPLVKCLMYINRILYSIDIDYRADLAGGFYVAHGLGIVIGFDVKTEGPVKIYQGVTLGGNNGRKRIVNKREFTQPWLKKGAIVYANSTIVGPCIIGENTVIGTTSLITKDVKDNMTVYNKSTVITKSY